RQTRQAHARVESASRERRDCARRVADEQATPVRDSLKHAAHGYAPSASLNAARAREVAECGDLFLKPFKRAQWVEARGIAADADVRLLAVVHDPCEIARRESRVEEAVEARLAFERHAFENILDADDPLAVLVEFEVARDARARAVAADDVACRDASRETRALKHDDRPALARFPCADVARRRRPPRARAQALFEQSRVESSHTSDAELVVRALNRLRAARWRVERDAPYGTAQTVLRQREVFERAADEDARRVNRVFELVLAINQQHAHAPTRQKPRQLKTGKPRAHDYNVELFHKHFPSESSNSRGSRSRHCPCGQRLNSVFLCKKLFSWPMMKRVGRSLSLMRRTGERASSVRSKTSSVVYDSPGRSGVSSGVPAPPAAASARSPSSETV